MIKIVRKICAETKKDREKEREIEEREREIERYKDMCKEKDM